MRRHALVLLLVAVGFGTCACTAQGAIFYDALGFEDDVDIIVSPNFRFMVICEETEDGLDARARILELDPATGEPIGFVWEDEGAVGFENGVDPMIITLEGDIGAYLVLIPTETEDGSHAKLIMLVTDASGSMLFRRDVDLGDLGFRDDVDCIWAGYTGGMAFFPLESEDNSVRGVLALDVDTADDDWGSCRLLSTDGRIVCGANDTTSWLPGLADGIDPFAYEIGDRLRLALPVSCPDSSDLLLLDFDNDVDPGDIPPVFITPHRSVKQHNAAGARPLAFPGYEADVDLILFNADECGLNPEKRSILIPVEGPGDNADLYLVDEDGLATWAYSIDGGGAGLNLPGYREGVDLLPLCNLLALDPPHRLAAPVIKSDGTEADVWIINLPTGALLARLRDPLVNPGLNIPGYEVGVDLVRWTPPAIVAAVESTGCNPGLLVFRPDGTLADSEFTPSLLGFQKSVDPIVAPVEPSPALIVPIGTDDGSDADVLVFTSPPNFSVGYSLEGVNAGLLLSRFEWDVDLGLLDKTAPGELYLCVPEESPGGSDARLRFEMTAGLPGDRVLAFATDMVPTTMTSSLYLVDLPTGSIILERNDLLGLETGLDLNCGSGPITPGDLPWFLLPTGVDFDRDPTLVWLTGSSGVDPEHPGDVGAVPQIRLTHPNPFPALGQIRYVLPKSDLVDVYVTDISGRIVRHLFRGEQEAGEHSASWNTLSDGGVRVVSGVYFLRVRGREGVAVSKLILVQ